MEKNADYKQSLHLPKTDFPMRANLTQKELEQLAQWDRSALYTQVQERHAGQEKYILHDGPPYANGHIHIGHALNKILKDFVVKSRSMSGYAAPFVPGWDCHGLPIEHQVLKELGPKKQGMSKGEIRKRCREYADKFVQIQREEFKRLGVFGDWDHPYLTMTPDYEAAIVREFGKVIVTGDVYKSKKPVLWCPVDETALAEAEVEYADHTSPSIYVKFPIVFAAGPAEHLLGQKNNYVLIWTTTPWTLPANLAIALDQREEYSRIRVNWRGGQEFWILATKRLGPCLEGFGLKPADIEICDRWPGSNLNLLKCEHPWIQRKVEIVFGEHVTMDQGTGCVHTAPGHGIEDYLVGREYSLDIYAPVDSQGRFTQDVPEWKGMTVWEANPKIIDLLKANQKLITEKQIIHSYPHCWRCKNPVIFRATEQWFISMGDDQEDYTKSLRGRALDAVRKIANEKGWIPPWGFDRISGMIQNRPDWCISRQRVWGVPIVAFDCLDCGAILFSKEIADHVADLMEKEGGSDIWFSKPAAELLPAGTRCAKCAGSRFQQEIDILDVWFESGVSYAAVLKRRPELKRPEGLRPANLYLEGSDQHRGWFHSTLLVALETDKRPPYEAVLTHGFTVDGSGKKMSKSAGNVVAPQEVTNRYGAEILRLWVAATDFREDVRISPEILGQLVEAYRKIRNTCRFLLGNLYDFRPEKAPPKEAFHEIDRWALHALRLLNEKVQRAYRESEFHLIFHALNNFCAADLSAFYLDILKDRLYTSAADAPERRAAQAVLQEILSTLVRLMAPILSFTAEEIWRYLPQELRSAPSVHLTEFPAEENYFQEDQTFFNKWDRLIRVRQEVARALEEKRKEKKIGNSLEAGVTLFVKGGSGPEGGDPLYRLLEERKDFLPSLFIVSQVDLISWEKKPEALPASMDGLAVQVQPARGAKCERCWVYRESVGSNSAYPTLCHKCAEVLVADRFHAN